jgi:hypothetical protein
MEDGTARHLQNGLACEAQPLGGFKWVSKIEAQAAGDEIVNGVEVDLVTHPRVPARGEPCRPPDNLLWQLRIERGVQRLEQCLVLSVDEHGEPTAKVVIS